MKRLEFLDSLRGLAALYVLLYHLAVIPGLALGLPRWPTLRLVILPQAVARVVPPLAGQGISLVKDSSIISLVSIQDLAFLGAEVAATTARVFETWIVVALFYFAVCAALSAGAARLERRFARMG